MKFCRKFVLTLWTFHIIFHQIHYVVLDLKLVYLQMGSRHAVPCRCCLFYA